MGKPPTAASVPPAPPEALAGDEWWTGQRCTCGLPVFRSLLSTSGREVLVHQGGWGPETAYLNAHPHEVTVAGEGND